METNSTSRIMEEIDLHDLWRTIVNHWKLILICMLVALFAALIYLFITVPVYRATAQVLIERSNPNVLSVQDKDKTSVIDPSGQDFYQTQYEVLGSRAIARDVIGRLHLEKHPEYQDAAKGGISLLSPLESLSNLIFSKANKTFTVSGDPPLGDTLAAMKPESDSGLIRTFKTRLKIQPTRNSRIVAISFDSIDPRLAALGANTVAQAYIDWNLGLRIKSSQSASLFLDEQVKQAKKRMEASEQAIQQYREKHGVSVMAGRTDSGRESQDLSRQRLSQASAQIMDATKKRIEVEIKYHKALDLMKDPATTDSIPEVAMSPIIISMKEKEVQMIREKTAKAGKYGPKHPEMIALNQELENLRVLKRQEIRNIVDTLNANYDISQKQERSLSEVLRTSEEETIGRDKIAIQFQVLQQEAESNRQLYDLLLKRLKESSVVEENRMVNIHIIDHAEVPEEPVWPPKAYLIFLALALGLILGIGLSFFRASWTARSLTDTTPN